MTDNELIGKIISNQLWQIRLQQQYKDNPLAMPPLTPEERNIQDTEWQEAVRRGLHFEIHERITEIRRTET